MKTLFKYLATFVNESVIQNVWEKHTSGGREYARFTSKLNRYKDEPQKPLLEMISCLKENQWKDCGTYTTDFMLVYTLSQQEREIQIHIHRDKGDLYGVFQKIESTQLHEIVNRLTADPSETLVNAIAKIDKEVKGIQARHYESMNNNHSAVIEGVEMRAFMQNITESVTELRRFADQ